MDVPPPPVQVRVGLLEGEKCDVGCFLGVIETLKLYQLAEFEIIKILDTSLAEAKTLKQIKILIIPGGFPFGLRTRITRKGLSNLKKWVTNGGGYVGICAGAVLVSSELQMVGLVPLRCVNDKVWRNSGAVGDVVLNWQDKTSEAKDVTMHYENGPLFTPVPSRDKKGLSIFAHFKSDIMEGHLKMIETQEEAKTAQNTWICRSCAFENPLTEPECDCCESTQTHLLPPLGEMPDKIAVCTCLVGKGRAALFSTHPELAPCHPQLLGDAIMWAANLQAKDNVFN